MKAAIFLAKGFEEIEAISIVDVLRRGEVSTDIISIAGTLGVDGAHGITINSDKLFYTVDFDEYDILILPGGMPGTENLLNNEDLCNVLIEFKRRDKYIGAICAAPSILGQLYLLKDEKATCYPGFEDQLIGCEYRDEDVVISNKIITAKGPAVAISFAFSILSKLKGKEYADSIKKAMLIN